MKMRRTFALTVPLGCGERAWSQGDSALMQRVELILGTRPETLPWLPEFGCQIWRMMGLPATPIHLGEARWSIEEALSRWLPDAVIEHCNVSLVPEGRYRDPGFLRAAAADALEAGLLHLGVEAALRIELSLKTKDGQLRAQLDLST